MGNPVGSPHRSTPPARRHVIQPGWGVGRYTKARVERAAEAAGVSPSQWHAAALLVVLEQPAAVTERLGRPWACPICQAGPATRASSTADVCGVCAPSLRPLRPLRPHQVPPRDADEPANALRRDELGALPRALLEHQQHLAHAL